MKKLVMSMMALSLVFTGCGDDDDGDVNVDFTGESKVYQLGERDIDGVSGTATFRELEDGTTEVTLDLDGDLEDGEDYAAHIHAGSAFPGMGAIVVTFTPVDGTTGESVTIVSELFGDDDDDDNDETITYDQLLNYNGYINVHKFDDLSVLAAQGDIGSNELTGNFKVYELDEKDEPGISGTATFEERAGGSSLVTLNIQNTIDGATHPAHIHAGNANPGGGAIIFSFEPVDGTTGISRTNLSALNDDTDLSYSDVFDLDAYINVHLGPGDDLSTIVAQGNIGSNED
ncbi:CHRD domain-containing protein [Gangjinia marincola]|uniref:CHRD domain-containing protein n=1 Tax=Gangjinia marincola TaxID=578463 RepID=A0ABP3XV98_9FLAO